MRILIVKTSSLGDVIHNLPIIADIRQRYPDAEIDWVVEESFATIPRLHPAISAVIPVALRRWRHALLNKQTWQEMAAFKADLNARNYDLVLDTQGLLKSAIIGRLANGVHHGRDLRSARDPLACLFYRHRHFTAWQQHAAVRNRQLAALALGYSTPASAPDYGIQASLASSYNSAQALITTLPPRYVIGLHGTSRDSKLWPVADWQILAQWLSAQGIGLLLPWGNTAEQQRARSIAARVASATVLPRLDLLSLATLMAGAQAAVGVDTGLVHLAVALDVPTLALYTDTDPQLNGVYAGGKSPAINLGGVANAPSSNEVLETLQTLLAWRPDGHSASAQTGLHSP